MTRAGNYVRGPRHPLWTGDEVTYRALHLWVGRNKEKPDACSHCGRTDRPIQWANVSKEYRRDLTDWVALCVRCHRAFDRSSHCQRGHPRSRENTFVDTRGIGKCRPCKNIRWRRRYYEKLGRVVPA